jgi:hypothetical protein
MTKSPETSGFLGLKPETVKHLGKVALIGVVGFAVITAL